MNEIIKAGADDLVWLVVVIFWVIAQIAGASAKNKKTGKRPAPQDAESRTPVDPFAELLSKLAGVQEFKTPEPEETPDYPSEWNVTEESSRPSEPPKIISRSTPRDIEKPLKTDALPGIEPPRRTRRQHEREMLSEDSPQVDIRPTMNAFRSSMPAMRMPPMNLRIGLPSYSESSNGREGLGDELHLKNKKALRRAMLSHIIFSPPKALE